MAKASETAFIGLRVPEADKSKLERQAEEQGLSLGEVCRRLLDGSLKQRAGPAVTVEKAQDLAREWEDLADELSRLCRKREELQAMVQERSGLFTSAPKSLKVALRAADCRIREATEKLEAMLPLDKEKRLSLIEEIFDSE